MTLCACEGACAAQCRAVGLPSLSLNFRQHTECGRARQRARAFVQRILQFEFDTLVPAHFLAPVPGGKDALAEAFKFLL